MCKNDMIVKNNIIWNDNNRKRLKMIIRNIVYVMQTSKSLYIMQDHLFLTDNNKNNLKF